MDRTFRKRPGDSPTALQFELHDYSGERVDAVVTTRQFNRDSTAFSAAGRLAVKNGGPVDLARAGSAPKGES